MISKASPDFLSPSTEQTRQRRPKEKIVPNPKAKLRDQLHEIMRFHHYSERTEETYWQWIVRFLKFQRDPSHLTPNPSPHRMRRGEPDAEREKRWRHPRAMGAGEVQEFLAHLATAGNVAAATQNQALNALVFLYGEVLHEPLGEIGEYARAQRPARLPEVLSRTETERVLAAVDEAYALPLKLLYGSGLRVMELLRLRVKDLDLERRQIAVRDGRVKGFASRGFVSKSGPCFTCMSCNRTLMTGFTLVSRRICGGGWPSIRQARHLRHHIEARGR
ncbi:MAG: phage integrase N-terminal SAM-like domain-containing protein [Verrucomicrobia bacterium]|nr:phage integrase N-terminal SAM-like domain-containing protein [Verrucomicrobiota bacterium]